MPNFNKPNIHVTVFTEPGITVDDEGWVEVREEFVHDGTTVIQKTSFSPLAAKRLRAALNRQP